MRDSIPATGANRFFTGKKIVFLPVKNPLPFLLVKYKFYQLISETKITLKK